MEGSRLHGLRRGADGGARRLGARPALHTGPIAARLPHPDRPRHARAAVAASSSRIDPEGPYGAKEAGEGPLHPSIPAIANAIYDAVGVRIDTLPFSPPKVLAALREKTRRRGGGAMTRRPVGAR